MSTYFKRVESCYIRDMIPAKSKQQQGICKSFFGPSSQSPGFVAEDR